MPNGPPVSAIQFWVIEPDDLGQSQGHEGQVVAAQPERGEAGEKADGGGDGRAHKQTEPRRDVRVLRRRGGSVGPERAQEAGVTERQICPV